MKHYLLICFLSFSFLNLSAQQGGETYRLTVSPMLVPQKIKDAFQKQYPDVIVRTWYSTHLTYWNNDYFTVRYKDWYGERIVIITPYEKPTYYEVEFTGMEGGVSRALYNLHGYWYETRSQVKGLTFEMHEALKETKYAGWKISVYKEKLESPMWPTPIYRFHVSKGVKSSIIRMDEAGNIIQSKSLKGAE